ncbi:putative Xaa-Pro dipeptidase [Blattamonas nauphoetae]|uniref:Xaa-Pro dipeptidase n=1 Tax=Blattamonas nauphoetae TaxID=2049346 RepID=A0ABQ9Y2T6_9EUKA|nr:putative Xaa-Pro dipeptidase [Blattamonas nauphoetae]
MSIGPDLMNYSVFQGNREHALTFIKHLGGVAIFRSFPPVSRPGTDFESPLRQESNFYYLTGCEDEDAYFVWDIVDNVYHVFFTIPPEDAKTWMKVEDLPEKKKFGITNFHDISELKPIIQTILAKKHHPIHILDFQCEKQVREECGIPQDVPISNADLSYFMGEARVIKTPAEIELMKVASAENATCFIETIKRAKVGMTETDLQAYWQYFAYKHGTRGFHYAFYPIFSFDKNASFLHHYAEDNQPSKEDTMCLLDAGTSYRLYSADVTRTFPLSGKFTDRQKRIYNYVLEAQESAIKMVKPEVNYEDLHWQAMRVIGNGLIKEGIIVNVKDVDEAIEKDLVSVFFSHGIGHHLGLDTHDVGGYPRGVERIQKPGFARLRTRRVLKEGMIVTVEPGCYFNELLIETALADPVKKNHLNAEVCRSFYDFGGVRIEDDIVVTKDGFYDLTNVPKSVEDVEALIASGKDLPRI